jgi:outer membrane phospholipase A
MTVDTFSGDRRNTSLVVALWIGLAVATSVAAGSVETMVAPQTTLQAGEAAVITVYHCNRGQEPVLVELHRQLTCRLTTAEQSVEVEASAVRSETGDEHELAPGAFIERSYQLQVPAELSGVVSLTVDELGIAGLSVAPPAPVEEPVKAEIKPQPFETLDSLFSLYQPYLPNIQAYQPMYLLVGANPEESKLQFSFKYSFFEPASLGERFKWTRGLNFGYTQTSFWDLKSSSKPFQDTSYKPELFYLSPSIGSPSSQSRLFIQGGFEHESNGRGGVESRSTNYIYVKPIFIWYNPATQVGLQVAPKIWTYVGNSNLNPDLPDYRGYFDLELKVGKADSFVLGSNLRWAREGASVQLDLTYPLHFLFKNLEIYLHAQYANTIAESMINYRQRTEAFRLGVAIVR